MCPSIPPSVSSLPIPPSMAPRRWIGFCSAFPDTDLPFGSVGDFFSVFEGSRVVEGSFEANPPFIPQLIHRMAKCIDASLTTASRAGVALGFVVIVPSWGEEKVRARGGGASRPYVDPHIPSHPTMWALTPTRISTVDSRLHACNPRTGS